MSVAASEGEPSLSGDDDSAALPPSGVVALSEPDPEMTAMLSRAAENIGLVWNPPPRPDPSRLDEWFLGGGRAENAPLQRPPENVFSAPLRCHSFRKCMRSLQGHGRHLLLPEINLVAPPPSPPSMVEPLWGTRASPLWSGLWPCSCVQQSLPLCGVNRVSPHGPVSTRQVSLAVLIEPVGRRLLPYTPWRYCRSIRPKYWETCTRVGTTWRFYMSCVLRRTSRSERRRWPHSLWIVRCPRLWSRSAISGCVSLTWRSRRRYSSWMLPCHRPAFSATLSRAVPSSFRQHRSRLRRSSTSCAGGNPLLFPLRLQPLSLLVAMGAPLWPPPFPRRGSSLPPRGVVEPVTDRTPVQAPARPGGKRKCKRPWDGRPRDGGNCSSGDGDRTTPSPGGGPGGESFVSFCFCSAAGPAASGTQNFNKRAVSSVSGSQEEESGVPCITGSLPSSSLARQGGVAQEHPSCPFVEPGKGSSTQAPATSRHMQAGLLRFLPHEEESGECYTTHPDPAPCHHRPGLHRPRAGSLCSTSLPHHGYVGGSIGAAGTVSRSLASAPQSVSVAPTDHQTRLCDSVRPASPQVQGHPVHYSQTRRCSCLACGNRSPTGEGRDRAGPSSRYEVGVVQPLLHCAQERWWVTTNLGSASFEPCTSQAAVQDVDAETHFWMRPSPRLVCSNRPEGHVLSCLDPPATQAIPAFRVRGTGVSVQGPALRAVPVASRLHQSRGGGPCPPERTRCAHSQLPRRLAHTRTVSQAVVCTQGPGAQAPQPAGPSGQLGKEQTRANAEDLFSRHGVRFGQPNSTPHPGTCSVSAELLQDLIRQDGGSTETLSEAPGAYGCSCGDSSARSAPYETASALALWPNPEVGVETRHLPGSDYTGLPQDLQAVVRSLVPSGRSAPGAGIQACCGIHRCLDHRLGSHVQRAHSIRGLDGSPTALAYQLPRVASSTPCPEPSQRAPSAQGCSGPYGQHCERCVYQPARRFALPSHLSQLARHLLLWSQKHLRSLRAIHIPGVFNRAADELSRAALPGEWRLHPQAVQLIWGRFGAAQVDLFASPETTHCQEFYSLTEATLGTDALAHSWPRGLCKYAFPPVSLLAQTLCKIREDEEQVLLVAPYWPNRTWFPELMLLATAPPWPIPLRKDLLSQRRAPYGTRARTCGNSTYGPWMGRGGSSWPTPGGSTHYHFSTGTVHETGLYSEVEPVRRMVFLPPGGPPEMLDQSCAFLLTARVGA